jgi:hypothetical protein
VLWRDATRGAGAKGMRFGVHLEEVFLRVASYLRKRAERREGGTGRDRGGEGSLVSVETKRAHQRRGCSLRVAWARKRQLRTWMTDLDPTNDSIFFQSRSYLPGQGA